MTDTISKITFVWNADFSIASGIRALKEAVAGEHSCTLCEIAYHRVTQTAEWKVYKNELQTRYRCEIREPCRNQLKPVQLEALQDDYPAVLAEGNSGSHILLGSGDINQCQGQFLAFKEKLEQALQELPAK